MSSHAPITVAPRPPLAHAHVDGRDSWARWQSTGHRYTVGIEEEVMLLDRFDHSLAARSDRVLPQLSDELAEHTSPETHAAVIELATGIHHDVAGAIAELSALRAQLALELPRFGLVAACAGMHPLGSARVTRLSGATRYRRLGETMKFLARREPTLALHVHVGVPDPENAVRVLNRLRENLPLLVALSANSPFVQGHDSGFASARTAIFDGFPRTGPPRAFVSYDDYVDAIAPLISTGALSDPTFLWWDVRLQPALGTVEVRVMDAQSSVSDSAPLVALVQSLARDELEGPATGDWTAPEVLAENRFLAARDGLDARLIDPRQRSLVPVRTLLSDVQAHANGAERQRTDAPDGSDLPLLVRSLADRFTSPPNLEGATDVSLARL